MFLWGQRGKNAPMAKLDVMAKARPIYLRRNHQYVVISQLQSGWTKGAAVLLF